MSALGQTRALADSVFVVKYTIGRRTTTLRKKRNSMGPPGAAKTLASVEIAASGDYRRDVDEHYRQDIMDISLPFQKT
jgi:hypothetical protein